MPSLKPIKKGSQSVVQNINKKAKDELRNEQKQKKQYVRPELARKDKLTEVTGLTMET